MKMRRIRRFFLCAMLLNNLWWICNGFEIHPAGVGGVLVRAVNVTGLAFAMNYSGTCKESFVWSHHVNGIAGTDPTATAGWLLSTGDNIANIENCGENSTAYKIFCQWNNCNLFSKFSIIRPLDISYNWTKIQLSREGHHKSVIIELQYCFQITDGMLRVDFEPPAVHKTLGRFYCGDTDAKLYYPYLETPSAASNSTHCNSYAQWEDAERYQCWFAPSVSLWINDTESDGKLVEGRANFSCGMQEGSPKNGSKTLHIGNKEYYSSHLLVINESHQNLSVYCSAENAFTIAEGKTIKTDDLRLDVQFAPKEVTDQSCLQRLSDGTIDALLQIKFRSNPSVTEGAVDLTRPNGWQNLKCNLTCEVQEEGWQLCNTTVQNVTGTGGFDLHYELHGIHGKEHKIEKNLSMCAAATTMRNENYDTQSSHIATTKNNSASTVDLPAEIVTVVAAASVGGLILLLLSVILTCCIMKKRRGSEGEVKKDVENPLYGTTSMSAKPLDDSGQRQPETQGAEKEERSNPLYGTTNASGQAEEVVYAPIVKKKKKKDKKNVAASSSSDHAEADAGQADVYASVDKIKNVKKNKKDAGTKGQTNAGFSVEAESMYAAVDKKKGKPKKKSSDEPSTSGLGTSGNVTQECTYAAVQKKGKKNPKSDDSDDEDLHGSTRAPKK